MAQGIAAKQLSDDDLRHELLQLKLKQEDIAADGTPHQQANHRERTAELEAEFVRRFGSEHAEQSDHDEQSGHDDVPEEPQPGIFPGAGDSQ
jgi:uncharacterized protein DUF6158